MSVFVVEKPQRQTIIYPITEKRGTQAGGKIETTQVFKVSLYKKTILGIEFSDDGTKTDISSRYLAMLQVLLTSLEKEGYVLAYQTKEAK